MAAWAGALILMFVQLQSTTSDLGTGRDRHLHAWITLDFLAFFFYPNVSLAMIIFVISFYSIERTKCSIMICIKSRLYNARQLAISCFCCCFLKETYNISAQKLGTEKHTEYVYISSFIVHLVTTYKFS